MLLTWSLIAVWVILGHSHPLSGAAKCSLTAISSPQIFGIDILDVEAKEVHNYTTFSLRPGSSEVSYPIIDFCNVTVAYTHPGWHDIIHVSIWLPLQGWNERLQALGGGGYNAGFGGMYMAQAVAASYVAIETDAGRINDLALSQSPSTWALTSPGNLNLYLLEDFATRSLDEMSIIGKSITQSYYGSPARYSYFSGCSGGGRQGLELAQRYPEHYDGILAAAPAINIERFIPAAYWASQVMQNLNYYPPPCEVEAFTQRAIDACDALDGLKDGIISEPGLCGFDAHEVVGQTFSCSGVTLNFTTDGATIVQAAWTGPRSSSGRSGWYGISKDAALTAAYVVTQCPSNSTSDCTAGPTSLLSDWFRYFVVKDPSWNISTMTDEQFFNFLEYSMDTYGHILGSSSSNLSLFDKAGGKMITWHGGADEIIPIKGTVAYYDEVLAKDARAADYYRFFEAPGVGHCIGGPGNIPNTAFDALVAWVERQVPPNYLKAVPQSKQGIPNNLYPYPLRQNYPTDIKQQNGIN